MVVTIKPSSIDYLLYNNTLAYFFPRYLTAKLPETIFIYEAGVEYSYLSKDQVLSSITFTQSILRFQHSPYAVHYSYAIIGQQIGQGGMGTTFHSAGILTHLDANTMGLNTDKHYVIKISNADLLMFARNEEAMMQTPWHKTKTLIINADNRSFFVMPYYGKTLIELIFVNESKSHRSPTLGISISNKLNKLELLWLCQDLAITLKKQCTDRTVIHYDIKPANISVKLKTTNEMVIRRYDVMIFDFGLARYIHSLHHHSGGTNLYKAPEVEQKNGSVLSDVFSLGHIFHDILKHNVDLRVTTCGALIAGMLKSDPENRFTINDVITILDQIIAEEFALNELVSPLPHVAANSCLKELQLQTIRVSHALTNAEKYAAYTLHLNEQKKTIMNHAAKMQTTSDLLLLIHDLHITLLTECTTTEALDAAMTQVIENLQISTTHAQAVLNQITHLKTILYIASPSLHDEVLLIERKLSYYLGTLTRYNLSFDDVNAYINKLMKTSGQAQSTINKASAESIRLLQNTQLSTPNVTQIGTLFHHTSPPQALNAVQAQIVRMFV